MPAMQTVTIWLSLGKGRPGNTCNPFLGQLIWWTARHYSCSNDVLSLCCLCTCLFVWLFGCLSVRRSICLFGCLSVRRSISLTWAGVQWWHRPRDADPCNAQVACSTTAVPQATPQEPDRAGTPVVGRNGSAPISQSLSLPLFPPPLLSGRCTLQLSYLE